MPPADAAYAPHHGLTLLRTIASAVLDLDDVSTPGTFTLPYPPEAQRALDRTVLACLLRGADPPLSVPDLLAWCRERPVVDWPLDLPDALTGPEDRLIDEHAYVPTDLCYEWAVDRPDSATEQIDRALVHTALDRCRAANAPSAYVAFRRLLIERPVLTRNKAAEIALEPAFAPLDGLLQQIYLPAPAGWTREGRFTSCRRCKTLLVPTRDGGWWCENARCRRGEDAPVGPQYCEDEGGGILLLTRPLRLFVTAPGIAELQLEQSLRRLGLTSELWPNYDAYDLRITLPDGRVWAVDVKDWANPALLGRNATILDDNPPYDEAFIVVPNHRTTQRRGYISVIKRFLPQSVKGQLTVLNQRQFVARVREVLAGHIDGLPVNDDMEDDDA
ncbi:pPIWI_RE_Y domain-containing protein [Kitasatospora sp. NPDC001175]|uniref:pPIWI_RE_Y domain-containing protein n=1 Tax=Kitasatospora sp. NPDC001175 TaxID=3157103 RepID=UPI003CFEEE71